MSDDANQYRVNFFKPKTDHAKANMKMVAVMVIIWAVAVFGFQILLIATQKPVAEKTLGQYESVASVVAEGKATVEQKQTMARSLLMVLGKNIVLKDPHKAVLKSTLSDTVASIDPNASIDSKALESLETALKAAVKAAKESKDEKAAEEAVKVAQAAKDAYLNKTAKVASTAIGLGNKDFDPILSKILVSSLVPVKPLSDADKKALPGIMKLYLTHFQSKLTDTRFLGFPFHYWYTAQFLLIMFVGLCWLFCKQTDRANRGTDSETEEAGEEK